MLLNKLNQNYEKFFTCFTGQKLMLNLKLDNIGNLCIYLNASKSTGTFRNLQEIVN